MAEKITRLPSKIVQIANASGAYDAWALCADGSVWCFDLRNWAEIHPPHEPPTHAADLAEALEVLSNLVEWGCVATGSTEIESREAFTAAKSLLRKHKATR